MKTSTLIVSLTLLFLLGALGIYGIYKWLFEPAHVPPIKEYITDEVWCNETWRMPEGYSYIKNNIWHAYVNNPSNVYGNAMVSQGIHAHGWVEPGIYPPVRKTVTIYRDEPSPILVAEFIGKRTMPIKWYPIEVKAWNNVGMCLWGDVGLDYDNPDTSLSRALIIDFYFDNPHVSPGAYWFTQGSDTIDNDYRSGLVVESMLIINQDYHFRVRLDKWIQKTLEHYNIPYFTIKLIQFYIEAKGSEGGIEVKKFGVGLA